MGRESHDANLRERYELFLLDDGQKKVTWKSDTRMYLLDNPPSFCASTYFSQGVPNTAIFTFQKEDHTLGNLLSQRLHKYNYIQFSAYIVAHPLKTEFDLRVTTDGSMTPKDAIVRACRDIVQDLDVLSREFTKEWELKKIANTGRDGL
jgi:DNA-directed RNA polymerase II subunit RPB11